MNKSPYVWVIVAAVLAIGIGVWFAYFPAGQKSGGRDVSKLTVPKPGDASPEEGVAVPALIREGESQNKEQQYWTFRGELKNGALEPFEFRLPVNDIMGLVLVNGETKPHTFRIFGPSFFVPNEFNAVIAPGAEDFFKTQVLVPGEYDILCSDCEKEIVGKIVAVP